MDDQPLFRADVKRFIREILAGGAWVKRNAIVRGVREAAGGFDVTNEKSTTALVKKCLRLMKDAGEVEGGLDEGTFAHYRLKPAVEIATPSADPIPADAQASNPGTASPPPIRTGSVEAARVIGHGGQSVYVYYFEADRSHSQTQGRTCWPCKVGLASRDAAGRLREQGATTARSAAPVWSLEIRTDDASNLERSIHRVLKYAGRQTTGGGAEWFLTTPSMVEAIYLALESIRCWPE